MFGIRLNRVFANRWNALGWSAMVLITAYCSIPESDLQNNDVAGADMTEPGEPTKATDPWAGVMEAAKKRKEGSAR